MLDIRKISDKDIHKEAWLKEKLGKISASNTGKLIGKESNKGKFTQVAITYIEGLVGERVTGKPSKPEFSNGNTDYGNATEAEAINNFSKVTGKILLRNEERGDTHRLIINDDYTACTPDALVCLTDDIKYIFDETGNFLKVGPLETKCPPVHHRFIKLYKCLTPQDLKETEPLYYWQCICQLVFTNSLIGWFSVYNPDFAKNERVIEFKKMNLIDDIKFFNATIEYAKIEIDKTVNLLK